VYASEAAGKEGAPAIAASPVDEEPLAEWERELLESADGADTTTHRFGEATPAATEDGTGDGAADTSTPEGEAAASAEETAKRTRATRSRAAKAAEPAGDQRQPRA
jgi:hypothetical protein